MIICSDCLVYMKTMPDNSVDAIVTDPPYGLSFMGKKWDYDVPSQEIWEQALRVLKPGGYLLSFAGTRTQHRMAVRIEDAGFEIRDLICWVYGQGFPKSLNIGKSVDKILGNERAVIGKNTSIQFIENGVKQKKDYGESDGMLGKYGHNIDVTKGTSEWEGWGTALKPALEPITVARKPIVGNVAQNCLKWGVGGINIDGCRVEYGDETDNRIGTDALAGGSKDSIFGGYSNIKDKNIQMYKSNGRFPANLIHDGSDEVVGLFPQTKGSATTKVGKTYGESDGRSYLQTKPHGVNINDSGSAARFFYCAKASKSERNRGCEDMEAKYNDDSRIDKDAIGCNNPNNRSGTPSKNFHPTVKPIALMEYLVKLVSKEGHTVLDPFMGSGSTGIACKKLNREFIGIELDADYCKIAEARINAVKKEPEQLTI